MYEDDQTKNSSNVYSYSWNDSEYNVNSDNKQDDTVFTQPAFTQPQQPYQPQAPKSPRRQKKWAGIIACIICAAVVCFGAGYLGSFIGNHFFNPTTQIPNDSQESPTQATGGDRIESSEGNRGDRVTLNQVNDSTGISQSMGDAGYTVAQVSEMTAQSVVEITTETVINGSYFGQYVSSGAGSGVIITEDGYIITNHHVIEDASSITVKLKDNPAEYPAILVGSDRKADIAVIKIQATGLQAAVLGDSDQLVVGEAVLAVGNPLGSLGGTVTNGIISALDREIEIDGEKMTLLQTNAAINPGNSGGGLFNGKGLLIGIVNAKSSGTDIEGLGFAIPINTAKAVAEDLINYGYVTGRVSVGVTLVDISNTQTAIRYGVQYLGVYVLNVTEGGSGEQAGLARGDCILSVAGLEVSTSSEVSSILDQYEVGDTVPMVVYRNRQQVSVTITLQEDKG